MTTQQKQQRAKALLICGLAALLFLPLIGIEADLPLIGFLEQKSRDLRFLLRGEVKPSGQVVIGAIDDRSIQAIGRWPWPRRVIARTIQQLHAAGAEVVAVDLLFSEPEKNNTKETLRQLMDAYAGLGLLSDDARSRAFYEEMEEQSDALESDAILGAVAVDAGNVILGMAFLPYETPGAAPAFLQAAALPEEHAQTGIFGAQAPAFSGVLLPIDILGESAASLGFVNALPDSDGALRRGLLILRYGDRYYLSLGVQALQHYLWSQKALPAGKPLIPEQKISADPKGQIRINYYGPHGTLPHYSIIDILTGATGPAALEGKIVFIGGAALGLGDHWPNPFSEFFWGVETHATIADNLLTHRVICRPQWAKFADALGVLLMAAMVGIIGPAVPVALLLPIALLIGILYIGITQSLFAVQNLLFLWVLPLTALALMAVAILLLRYFTEVREKRFLRAAFGHYVNSSVVDRVLSHPEKLSLGGEKKDLTVLFSDIRDFTAISERLEPESLVRFMNRYLTAMSDIILAQEGTLDKYIGDAIMAVYGAPEDQPDHARRACATAIRMMQDLHDLQESWGVKEISKIVVGVGINTGPMVVGNMGSSKRFDYTVMGDNVNLGARLEGLTKLYRVKIIVSEFTKEKVKSDKVKSDFVFRELDWVRVKGRNTPIRIYELFGKDYYTGGAYSFIPLFEKGLAAYRNGEWDLAISFFDRVLAQKPEDAPALLFKERCIRLKKSPLQMPWDGVYIASEK